MTLEALTPDWRGEHRELHRLAWPAMLSTLCVPLVTLTDTAVVGHLPGAWPLASVALAGGVYGVIATLLSPFRGVAIGLTGRWFGAGESERATDWTLWGLAIAALGGAAIALAAPLWIAIAQAAFSADAETRAGFAGYLSVRLWELPFVVAQMFLLGHLRGFQRAWAPAAATVLVAGLNAGLNVAFVWGLQGGVAGSAWASLAANALGALFAWVVWQRAVRPRWDLGRFWQNRRQLVALRGVFGWGVARGLLLMGALAAFTAAASRSGAAAVAAHAVLMQLWLLSSYAIDGFATGLEALVARRLGEGDGARLRLDATLGLAWCVGIGLGFAGLFAAFGEPLVRVFAAEAAVVEAARAVLPWVVVMQPIVAVSYWGDGVLTGAVAPRRAFVPMAAGLVGGLAVAPFCAPHGLFGVWAALAAFSLARAAWSWRSSWACLRLAPTSAPAKAA